MHPVPRRIRLAQALRKLLPGNPLQTVFLLAAVCLSACIGRSWLALPDSATLDAIGPLSNDELVRWVRTTQFFALPLLLAGIGAYSRCFLQRENPARNWRGLVVVPACIGIAGGFFVPPLIVLNRHYRSVLEKYDRNPFRGLRFPLRALILNSGTGFQLAVLGVLLALLGGWLLRKKVVSLPVQFGPPSLPAVSEEFDSSIHRKRIFAIYALTLSGFVGGLLSLPLNPILIRFLNSAPSNLRHSFSSWLDAAQFLSYLVPLFLLAMWTPGKNRRLQLHESARLPPVRIFALAIVLPIAAHWLPHVAAYAIDRVAWAQHWSAMPDAPFAKIYLHIPAIGPHLIVYALAAALSEWGWRGCMQPQFIRTFGVFRGIFVLGILYGSVQTLLYPRVFQGLPGFFFHLLLQLIWGIVWSIIYGWLTLSAASVWPAVVCAALSGILTQAAMTDAQEMIPRQFLRLSLLVSGCIIAFLLVRFLPLAPERVLAIVRTPPISESTS
jgi:hypothetical protein